MPKMNVGYMIQCCAPHPHFNRGGPINSDDQVCPHIEGAMVTISITVEAIAVIAATLPDGREAERRLARIVGRCCGAKCGSSPPECQGRRKGLFMNYRFGKAVAG